MSTDTDGDVVANLYERLVSTLSRHTISRETAGLFALQLAGGVSRERSTGETVRGEIHLGVLFTSNTDTARLLTHLSELSPDSTYVNGTGTSPSGLIADSRGGNVSRGVFLDGDYERMYVDKAAELNSDTKNALGEILSVGSYTISKSDIHQTFFLNSSILFADTLKYGELDGHTPISEELDHLLPAATRNCLDVASIDTTQAKFSSDYEVLYHSDAQSGLRSAHNTEPKISSATVDDIKSKLDSKLDFEHPTISVESIRRLVEARARLDYTERVSKDHVDEVVDLLHTVLERIYGEPEEEETGQFDAEVVTTGSAKTQRDRIKSVKQLVDTMQGEYPDGVDTDVVISKAVSEFGMDRSKVEKEIENLRRKGEMYEPTAGQLRTS